MFIINIIMDPLHTIVIIIIIIRIITKTGTKNLLARRTKQKTT